MAKRGHLFIISAPSGAGKSSILSAILKKDPGLRYSISYTTRPPRGKERDGVDYYFISDSAFRKKIDAGELAEWAEVHGHLYGTSARYLEDSLDRGHDILFDIDVEGAKKLYAKYPEAILVFIAPPSMEELKRRLVERGTDSAEAIERRLKNAKAEMAEAKWYHHVIVNDDLAQAVSELKAIIEQVRSQG
ncbi:MAG: guanylate kinase [Deltaproteobacteria bacterium]|nr:MAG: guanylate kinase [Deltaproteobacteria bacterium]